MFSKVKVLVRKEVRGHRERGGTGRARGRGGRTGDALAALCACVDHPPLPPAPPTHLQDTLSACLGALGHGPGYVMEATVSRLGEETFQPKGDFRPRTSPNFGEHKTSLSAGQEPPPTCEPCLRGSSPPPQPCLLGAPLNLLWKPSVSCTVSRLTVMGHTHSPCHPRLRLLPRAPTASPDRGPRPLKPSAATRGPAPPWTSAQAPHKRPRLISQVCANLKTSGQRHTNAPPSPTAFWQDVCKAIVAISCGLKKELSGPQGH